MSRQQNRSARGAIFGGLAGGIFFFGLAIAITTSQFLPVFFATMALSSLVGSLSSSNAQGIYGGFQGFVFMMGLAVIAFTDTWWPGILVLLGIMAILGTLNIPGIAGLFGLGILSRGRSKPQEANQQPYQSYQEGYSPQPTYQEGGNQYQYPQYPPPTPEPIYEQPQAQYPQEMPPLQQ